MEEDKTSLLHRLKLQSNYFFNFMKENKKIIHSDTHSSS